MLSLLSRRWGALRSVCSPHLLTHFHLLLMWSSLLPSCSWVFRARMRE